MSVYLVTGGAGFVGSALVRRLLARADATVVTLDRLTYAGSLEALASVRDDPRHVFAHADVCDAVAVRALLARHRPDAVLHLAAESHVDRSIDAPAEFVRTNVEGTFTLLQEARRHWEGLAGAARDRFRVVHVSTDEVFGSVEPPGRFAPDARYDPSSPYSATKAASDHLARAWHRTYGLPVVVTHGSNTYGPFQFPEKLIPLTIQRALAGRTLPVYGDGAHVRDWLHVDDHAGALAAAADRGAPGATYLVGGGAERRNVDVVRAICRLLDERAPTADARPHETHIEHVADRPGHDRRYALDADATEAALAWRPAVPFDEGLRRTVEWYLAHPEWLERARTRGYGGERLGLAGPAAQAHA